MLNLEHVHAISQSVYNLVPHHVDAAINEVENADFKAFLLTQKLRVETIVVFHATSIVMHSEKDIGIQKMLHSQLAALADSFIMTYALPRGMEFTKNFMKMMDADDFLVLFSEELVMAGKMVADRVKSELATAGVQ